jgi:hypothetical protein
MIALAMTFLRFAWPFLLLGAVYLYADHGWCNGACKSAKAQTAVQEKVASTLRGQFEELDRQRIVQQERWAQATAAEEQRERVADEKRKQVFAGLKDRSRHSDFGRTAPVSAPVKRMLGDAYAAAEAAEAPATPDTATSSDSGSSTVADLIVWSVDILEWAGECRARVEGWQKWYTEISK